MNMFSYQGRIRVGHRQRNSESIRFLTGSVWKRTLKVKSSERDKAAVVYCILFFNVTSHTERQHNILRSSSPNRSAGQDKD